VSERPAFGGGASGNREVPRPFIVAYAEEEGGSRGKHGFPRGSEPKASDERGVFA
jgi:hypothetical protein